MATRLLRSTTPDVTQIIRYIDNTVAAAGYQELGLTGLSGGDATGLAAAVAAGYQECGLGGKSGASETGLAKTTAGYQECGLSGKSGATETGLAGVTPYYLKVAKNGGTVTEATFTTAADTTFTGVIALLNAAMTGAISGCVWGLSGGDLRCTSPTTGPSSTIALSAGTTGTDFFATLTGFTTFDSAVPGVTSTYYFKVAKNGGAVTEKSITTAADSTFTAVMALMNAQMTGAISGCVFGITGGDLRCTSPTTGPSSTIALSAGTTGTDLFATLTGFTAFDTAVIGTTDTYYFKVNHNKTGVTEKSITTTGGALTWTDILILLNAAMDGLLTGATWGLSSGDIRCTASPNGTGTFIALSAGTTGFNLFASLTGFTAFDTAVAGVGPAEDPFDYSNIPSTGHSLVYPTKGGIGIVQVWGDTNITGTITVQGAASSAGPWSTITASSNPTTAGVLVVVPEATEFIRILAGSYTGGPARAAFTLEPTSEAITAVSATAPLTLSLTGGTLSGTVAVTPTNPGGAVALQAATPGTAQTGSANLTGTIIAGGFTGNVTGNTSGTAANVTGIVTPAHGGFGADESAATGITVWAAGTPTISTSPALGTPSATSIDVALLAPTAHVVEQYNGANAQRFSVYNTYTSATNFERASFDWSTPANVFHLTTKYGSTGGSPRPMVFGGGNVISDVVPQARYAQGQSAWSQATVNTAGANLNLAGGLGRRFFTIVSNAALATKTVTLTANGTLVTLTASAGAPGANQFGPIGTDDTAPQLLVTSTALATAISAQATLGPLMTPTVSAANVYLDKTPTLNSLVIATGTAGALVTTTSGTDGSTMVAGNFLFSQDQAFNIGAVAGNRPQFIYANAEIQAGPLRSLGVFTPGLLLLGTDLFGWRPASTNQSPDLILTRRGAATLNLGNTDAAAPVAQTLSVQSVVAGTADTAGVQFNLQGSLSTGAGAGGPIAVKTAYPGAASTVQNTLSTRDYKPSTWTTLTETTDTPIATLTFGASGCAAALLLVTIQANDATDFQSMSYYVQVNTVRKATGNTVTTIGVIGTPPAVAATSVATLTAVFTATEGAGATTINCNATSSLIQTTLRATLQLIANGPGVVVAQL